jgi:quinol monooxygenase YgiN
MYTRIVSFSLKPNASPEFTKLIEQKFVPTLRNEPGFQDLLVFVTPGGPEVVAISIWDSKDDADSYVRNSYRDILRALEPLIEKKPEVETYQLAYSTLHGTGLSEYPRQSPNVTPPPGVGGG